MIYKKIFLTVLTIIILLAAGLSAWKFSINKKSRESLVQNTNNTDELVKTVSGYVASIDDPSLDSPRDAPKTFTFTIQKNSDSAINVSYTAYPPSPAGSRRTKKITLNFYSGTVRIGDYLKARGTYNPKSSTIIVENEGDYIETYPNSSLENKMYSCESDKDCALVSTGSCCQFVSVNKNFTGEAKPTPKICLKVCYEEPVCREGACSVKSRQQ